MVDAALGNGVLALDGVSAGYRETIVLEDLSFQLGRGESVSIIGRNGVGKTTLLATIMGYTVLHRGTVRIFGSDAAPMSIHARALAGIGYVPQEREVFPSLTTTENLMVAARPGRWTAERVMALFPQLSQRARNRGSQLSGGEQQMLSIARALMGNPSVLLMDEPSEGLAPVIVEALFRTLTALRADDELSIVLVEQNSRIALAFSERTLVMDRGRIVYDGKSAALKQDSAQLERLIGVTGQ